MSLDPFRTPLATAATTDTGEAASRAMRGCILVGTDFSDAGRAALDWAIALARPLQARIVLAHVYDLPLVGLPDAAILVGAETASQLSDEAQRALDGEIARVRSGGVPVEGRLLQGDPRDILPSQGASSEAMLIVVGSHGRRGLARALMGSVAETLVRTSNVPVAVVRSHIDRRTRPRKA
jgi:nucleotide-binding universal stress UspA family protein